MRRVFILIATAVLAAAACSPAGGGQGGVQTEAPDLLRAVPADALEVAIFDHCQDALDQLLDSTHVLRSLDYGKLARHKAVLAMCDVGSLTPLLIIETSRAAKAGSGEKRNAPSGEPGSSGTDAASGALRPATDTIPAAAFLARQADSLQLFSAQQAIGGHNTLLLSPSYTVVKTAKRHLETETSILDAPLFDGVLQALDGKAGIALRNSGAAKLFPYELCSIPRKQALAFIRSAAEWTVIGGEKLQTVQPQSEKYYANFLDSVGEGSSRLGDVLPADARLVIDLPIADLRQWRSSYETLLDARMELEQYTKRLQELRKSAGKSPLDWEKELDVREVAYVASDSYRINLVRTGKSTKQDGIQDYPWAGFARALYGAPFCSDDVCSLRIGAWIISGSREALESLLQDASPVESEATEGFKGSRKWPSRVTAAVQTRHFQVFWTKNNTTIWQDSNL